MNFKLILSDSLICLLLDVSYFAFIYLKRGLLLIDESSILSFEDIAGHIILVITYSSQAN